MAANVQPIFSRQGAAGWANVTTGNSTRDLTGGTIYLIFDADATEGGRVDKVILQPRGTNVATVIRLFINNGSATGTAANNTLIDEITMPATTASETARLPKTEIPLDLPLPPGYRLYATTGTTISAGIQVTAVGGRY